MTTDYELEIDPLSIGLTRPAMFLGLNIRVFFINLVVAMLICIDFKTWMGIPIGLLAHAVMVKLSMKEPQFYFLWWKAFSKTSPVLNTLYWGKTNSYEPW